jgi:hypothetical protein
MNDLPHKTSDPYNFLSDFFRSRNNNNASQTVRSALSNIHISNIAMSSPPQNHFYLTLSEWIEGSTNLKPNKSIELDDGEFIRIKSIHKDPETTEVFLRGWRFRRLSEMNGILKKAMNEVCLVVDLTEDDKGTGDKRFRTGDGVNSCHQGLEDVPLSRYKRVRKLVVTNRKFRGGFWRGSCSQGVPLMGRAKGRRKGRKSATADIRFLEHPWIASCSPGAPPTR